MRLRRDVAALLSLLVKKNECMCSEVRRECWTFLALKSDIFEHNSMLSPSHFLIFHPKMSPLPACRNQDWLLWSADVVRHSKTCQFILELSLRVNIVMDINDVLMVLIGSVGFPRTGKQSDKSSVVFTLMVEYTPMQFKEWFWQGSTLSSRNVNQVPATKINLELLPDDLSLSGRDCIKLQRRLCSSVTDCCCVHTISSLYPMGVD